MEKKHRPLTPKQKQLLDFIVEFQTKNNKIPLLSEMATLMKTTVPAVQHKITALTRKRFLQRENIYKILSPANCDLPSGGEKCGSEVEKAEDFNILTN